MSEFTARDLTRAEINRMLREIEQRNEELTKGLSRWLGRTMMQAGFIVAARAKEILKEKGHVVTGNLGRTITASIKDVTTTTAEVEVGTFMVYAQKIEALPDGGYLFPALEEKQNEVVKFLIDNGINPALENWGRA